MCCEILDCKLISIGGLIIGILSAWVKVVSLQNSFILKDLPGAARVSVAHVNIFDNCSAWGFMDHVGSVSADPRPSWAIACGYKWSEEAFYPIQITGCCQENFFLSILSLTVKPFKDSDLFMDSNYNFPPCRHGLPWRWAATRYSQGVLKPGFGYGNQ